MFCNKCGSQLNDGMNFCNNCGNPVAPAAPQTPIQPAAPFQPAAPIQPQQPMYQPPVAPMAQPQPEPPKKKKTGLIIGIVSAVLVIAVAVFCITAFVAPGFLIKKDQKSDKKNNEGESTSVSSQVNESTTTTTTSTPPQNEEEPADTAPAELTVSDKATIESLASESMELSLGFNLKATAENEIVGWESIETVIDEYFMAQTGAKSPRDAYSIVDKNVNSGGTIKNAETLLQHYVSSENYSNYYESIYGENFLDSAVVTVKSIESISPSTAKTYTNMTKDSINILNTMYATKHSLDQPEWNKIEKYAVAECSVTVSGNGKMNALTDSFVFGFIDGEWTIVFAAKSTYSLYSLAFLHSLIN